MNCFVVRCARSIVLFSTLLPAAVASSPGERRPAMPPANKSLIDAGKVTIASSALSLDVLRYSGTVAGLHPRQNPEFDYTPADRLEERSGNTFYHFGDLDLRLRRTASQPWRSLSTAYQRKPATVLQQSGNEFRTDITGSLPGDAGLRVVRSWKIAQDEIQLQFTVTNTGSDSVELGGVGIPMVFNNMLFRRNLDEAYQRCSFYEPYIGLDAGYVQVVPLKGTGPVLLLAPLGHTPLEAWKPILSAQDKATGLGQPENDPTPRSVEFEGSFDWMTHTAAYAATDWHGVRQWNPPTAEKLAPGQATTFGLRLFVAPGVRSIEATLRQHQRPVAVGIPGYVLPQDMQARLFLHYGKPVRSIVVDPSNAIAIHDDGINTDSAHAYTLQGKIWGDARVQVTYDDGLAQTISYRTTKPEAQALADLGRFSFKQQWYTDPADPFHRAPSIMSYDNEAHAPVLQESRAWIAGLSDEGGAGAFLAASMKELLEPDPAEVEKLESFVDGVLWGHLQVASGEHAFGVRKSLFFYQPDAMPGFQYAPGVDKGWIWNQKEAFRLDRTYNYPHVVAAYWALYRTARNTSGLRMKHDSSWYLNQAFQTTMAMQREAAQYMQYGLMEGTVFTFLLDDLRAEGWNDKAEALDQLMRQRDARWRTEAYPFGSEMPWDSTGQEEVYAWTRRFGDRQKAEVTLNAVLGYTPTLPNWGYNGSAKRYWDFGTAGKYSRLERMLHHYGSGLNAIPLLTEFRDHPDDLYLLRVGYGGVMGPLTNIDQDGFASVAFHAFPDRLDFDPYTGDYGSNLFGHAINTGVYLVQDNAMGWLCFGGNLQRSGASIHVAVLDSSRRRVFVAPLNLWVTLQEGKINAFDLDEDTHRLVLHLAPKSSIQPVARIRIESTGSSTQHWKADTGRLNAAGLYEVGLGESQTDVIITQ